MTDADAAVRAAAVLAKVGVGDAVVRAEAADPAKVAADPVKVDGAKADGDPVKVGHVRADGARARVAAAREKVVRVEAARRPVPSLHAGGHV